MSAPPSGPGESPRLGRYTLGERLGSGGVAEVFRATVIDAGDPDVVVKRIRPELRANAEVRAAFVREAELAQHLHHPDVVSVIDLGDDDDDAPYLVLALVEGCTLQRLLDDAPAGLPVDVVLHVVLRIAGALAYVHAAGDALGQPLGLVHRDVTPPNVLLGRDGAVKLTDFGIARAAALGSDTLPGFIKGTVRYLSPEQAAGRTVDARTDVFALGLVLRRALVGDGTLDDLDPELRAIIEAATEPAVRDRLPSAQALAERLQQHRESAGIGDGAAALVELVTTARTTPRRVRSLDAALAGSPAAPTRQLASAPMPTLPRRGPPWMSIFVGTTVASGLIAGATQLAGSTTTAVDAADEPPPTIDDTPTPTPSRTITPPEITPPHVAPRDDAPVDPTSIVAPVVAKPKPRAVARGRLLVNPVPYAQVEIDGKDEGTTPIDRSLAVGEHDVELYNPDTLRRKSMRVTITAGEPYSITHW